MTDKEIFKVELDRLKEETTIGLYEWENGVEHGRMEVINALYKFLDSISEQQVWHDGKEEPEDKSKAVVYQLGDKTHFVFTMEYNKSDKNFHITEPLGCEYLVGLDWPGIRWAYPEDLLPTK